MKHNNNEQIVFDMFEEVATESIAEARNAYSILRCCLQRLICCCCSDNPFP